MNIFLTILAGAGTFVLGQVIIKLLIEPVQSLKTTIADISNVLIMYANVYANPKLPGDERQNQMAQEMRILSSKLQSNMHLIPCYKVIRFVFGLPSIENVIAASKNLIFIHNGHDGVLANQALLNCYAAQKAKIALNIFIPEGELLNPEDEAKLIEAKGN